MEASGILPEQIAENFWFVFFAYFLVIAAWYAVSRNVFISSRWRSVAEVRKRGQRVLVVLSLGMAYLAVYVYFQTKSGDYKEVCLALVALAVAILHMLRTVLGLWQLHVFKHWLICSIGIMESLGYRIELSDAGNRRNLHRGRSSAAAPGQGRDNAHFDADNIIVNDTIVGNRLSERDVQYELQLFTQKQKHDIFCANSFLMQALLTLLCAVESTMCLGGIVWTLLFSRSPLYSNPDSSPFLRPREPEELWLRWATVLISCAFPNWVDVMKKSRSEETVSQELAYRAYRDRFAEDILRNAALHCEIDTIKTSSGSVLPFHLLRKFPKLSNGTFCKQEFLKNACTTGNGLPFQAPHNRAASRVEKYLVYSYAKYRSKLEEARDALPVNEGEKLTCLGTEELEWLSILLSFEGRSIGIVEENNHPKNPSNVPPPKSSCSGIAIENLRNQLGFSENMKGVLAAPLLKRKQGSTLWGNRNVLKLSAHVDNWLALLAGEQVASIVQQVPGMKEGFLYSNLKAKGSLKWTQELAGVTQGSTEENIHPEKQRLMFYLSVTDSELSHFDQSLTFLGCSMENLRSSLARWVESNPEEQSGLWAPTLASSRVSDDAMNFGKFEFRASNDFELRLLEVSSVSCWSQRYLQMRVLWELQNNLHNTLSGCGLSPNQTEAILLCILSFPAIQVVASQIEQTPESVSESAVSVQGHPIFCCIKIDEKPPTFSIEDCKLTLRASYGPQNVHIEVFFARQVNETGIAVTAQLCCDDFEKDKSFVWEAWRDAFYRSLQSTNQWQVEHQLSKSSLTVRPCTVSIREGISEIETGNSGIGPTMKVWKGWPPHRETLSKYEMMTDGLILERKETASIPWKSLLVREKSTFVACPPVQYVPVSYGEAKGQCLTHACLIAKDVLRNAAGCSVDEVVGASSKGRRDLELLRYEILATRAGDDVALGKAIKMLISGNPNHEATERAVELLEEYITSETAKAPSVRILESLSRPPREKNWVQKVKEHYEVLMTSSRFDPIAAISFARFCSSAPSYCKEVRNEDGIRALVIAILQTTCSGNILLAFELTKSLEVFLETGSEGWYYLACKMALSEIEQAIRILSRTRNGAALTNAEHCTRGFKSFFGTFERIPLPPLLPDFRLELEKRKSDAQHRLEKLFKSKTYDAGKYRRRAEEIYTQAADNGDLVSTCHLAYLIQSSARAHPSRAIELSTRGTELYIRAMNGGVDSALNPLALCYQIGCGVPRNPPYAAELYSRAIEESGNITAMYNLADMLHSGAEGVPKDLPRAVQLFSRALEEGGDVGALLRVAFIVEEGGNGVPKNAPYAVRLYERAIKEGDHRAKNHLAHVLQNGADGVPANLKRAIALYKSAIDEIGDTGATVKLAELYQKGTGVPHDELRAAQLFESVIDNRGKAGKLALVHLADMLIEGAVGVPRDPIRAVELYSRAIEEHGCGDAMYELARVLEFGKQGVPSDFARAFSLYKRAASEKKHSKAARRLRKVEKQQQVLEQVQHMWSENTTEGDENLSIIDIVG